MDISIIIPAYNIEKYILECLQSITQQAFGDYEVLVVNDGSTDQTAQIVEDFAKNNPKIHLINQENQRVGAARNNGLNQAKGEYIMFVDGDDKLAPDALKILAKSIKYQNVDVTIFGALNFTEKGSKTGSYSVEKIPSKLKNSTLTQETVQKNIFKFPVLSMCKIYKREFLIKNDIKFQDCRAGEDQIFHIAALLLAEKVFVSDKNLYYYRRNRKNSLTSSKQKKDNSPVLNFYAIDEFLNKYEFSEGLKFRILNKYFVKAYSWLGKCSSDYKKTYYNDLKNLQTYLQKNYSELYWGGVEFYEDSSYFNMKLNILKAKFLRGKNGTK